MSLFWGLGPYGGYGGYGGYGMGQEAISTAHDAQRSAHDAQQNARDLVSRLDQLTLICGAMWELLSEKTGLTEKDLHERVQQIDARDGVVDGRLHRQITACPKCGRTLSARHQQCIYCGYRLPANAIFSQIDPPPAK